MDQDYINLVLASFLCFVIEGSQSIEYISAEFMIVNLGFCKHGCMSSSTVDINTCFLP